MQPRGIGTAIRWMRTVPVEEAGIPPAGPRYGSPALIPAPAAPVVDANGFDRDGLHTSLSDRFDRHGFDVDGRHRNGSRFDDEGNDVNLYSPARPARGNPYFPTAADAAAREF